MLKIIVLIILASCSPNDLDDHKEQGEAICKSLIIELKKVHVLEDLKKAKPKLREEFIKIAKLMVEANNLQKSRGYISIVTENTSTSDELLFEMQRIYQIPGAQKMVEQMQSKCLDILEKN